MKKSLLALLILTGMQLNADMDKCQNCVDKEDKTAQVVITNFASMIMNVIQMAANPHNPQTLVNGGCNIIAGIANIAQEACKMVEQGIASSDEIAEVFYAKMIELGVHEEIASHISRSQLKQLLMSNS